MLVCAHMHAHARHTLVFYMASFACAGQLRGREIAQDRGHQRHSAYGAAKRGPGNVREAAPVRGHTLRCVNMFASRACMDVSLLGCMDGHHAGCIMNVGVRHALQKGFFIHTCHACICPMSASTSHQQAEHKSCTMQIPHAMPLVCFMCAGLVDDELSISHAPCITDAAPRLLLPNLYVCRSGG